MIVTIWNQGGAVEWSTVYAKGTSISEICLERTSRLTMNEALRLSCAGEELTVRVTLGTHGQKQRWFQFTESKAICVAINVTHQYAKLTDREIQVLETLHLTDHNIQKTANILKLSPNTVRAHRTNIRNKCQLTSNFRFAVFAAEHG